MSLRTILIAALVLVVASLVASKALSPSSKPGTSERSAATPVTTVAGPADAVVAPTVNPQDVPDLRGRPRQKDVSQNAGSVRAYNRSHRLLQATPTTYRGVGFDSAGRTPDGRVVITASANGLPASSVRRVYRRLLIHLQDPGSAYALRITPEGAPR